MTTLTANGNSYSDDGSTAKDMRNGGHRTHLLPMLSDFMVVYTGLGAAVAAGGAFLANVSISASSANLTLTDTAAYSSGVGGSVDLDFMNASSAQKVGARIEAVATVGTAGAEEADFVISAIQAGTVTEVGRFRGAGGSLMRGTATNDSAAAGYIGQLISSTVSYDGNSITSDVGTNVTSISLTAGDWDVWFDPIFEPAGTTSITSLITSISATSATLNAVPAFVNYFSQPAGVPAGAISRSIGPARVSIAATTTYYGVVRGTFTVSTMNVWGILRARRVR